MAMEGTPVERLDWLRAVVRQCSGKAAAVAVEIEARWNRQAGCCWPSHPQLAADTGTSEDTVIRAIRELVAKGFLDVTKPSRQGRGIANEYRPRWEAGSPRRTATLLDRKGGQNCDPSESERVANATPKGSQPCGERVANGPEKGGAELRPQQGEENKEKEPRERTTHDEHDLTTSSLPSCEPRLVATNAPIDLPVRLRVLYGEIAKEDPQHALRTLQASRHHWGASPTEGMMRWTYSVAREQGLLDADPLTWPHPKTVRAAERRSERSGTTATLDASRAAAFAAIDQEPAHGR